MYQDPESSKDVCVVSVEEVGKAERQRCLKKRPASAMAVARGEENEAEAEDDEAAAAGVLKRPSSVMARPAAAPLAAAAAMAAAAAPMAAAAAAPMAAAAPVAAAAAAPNHRYGCSKCRWGRKGFEPYVIQILLIISLMSFWHIHTYIIFYNI